MIGLGGSDLINLLGIGLQTWTAFNQNQIANKGLNESMKTNALNRARMLTDSYNIFANDYNRKKRVANIEKELVGEDNYKDPGYLSLKTINDIQDQQYT